MEIFFIGSPCFRSAPIDAGPVQVRAGGRYDAPGKSFQKKVPVHHRIRSTMTRTSRSAAQGPAMEDADSGPFGAPRLDAGTLEKLRRILHDSAQPGEDLPGRIVGQFAVDARARVALLQAALARGDLTRFVETAHTLKGAAATVAAGRVFAVARFVELRAREGATDGLADVLDDLAREVEATIPDLARALAED
jgi:HPt (histidine-containing phosphotransfer) domain-containing protein